ncbi:MAG: cobalamin-binding protein [Phycisphaerae bacterium]|nr:cobalamin-binding protein [Phycisphaerae bacterium]
MADMQQISALLQAGRVADLVGRVEAALAEGVEAEHLLTQGLIAGMNVVGEKFRVSELFVPDVIFAGRAMTAAMKVLQPHLTAKGVPSAGRVVLGTVKGDLHDIGKNLVGMLLEGAGFTVINLGTDVSPEKFVEAARGHAPCLVGMSALLTTTMPVMAKVVEQLRAARLPGVRTMVGGAPLTQKFADEIGADGYAPDAGSAADLARRLAAAG